MLLILISMIVYVNSQSITVAASLSVPTYFPATAFAVNILLMAIRNIIFEARQIRVTNKINNKLVEVLIVTRKSSKYVV